MWTLQQMEWRKSYCINVHCYLYIYFLFLYIYIYTYLRIKSKYRLSFDFHQAGYGCSFNFTLIHFVKPRSQSPLFPQYFLPFFIWPHHPSAFKNIPLELCFTLSLSHPVRNTFRSSQIGFHFLNVSPWSSAWILLSILKGVLDTVYWPYVALLVM